MEYQILKIVCKSDSIYYLSIHLSPIIYLSMQAVNCQLHTQLHNEGKRNKRSDKSCH